MADATTPEPHAQSQRTTGKRSPTDNRYLDAADKWMERYGSFLHERNAWRRTAFMSLAITAFAVGGMIYASTQNQFIPYIVEVDRLGSAVSVGRAQPANGQLDQRIIQAQVTRWVLQARSVFVDAAAQRMMINGVYSMLSNASEAYVKLNEHYRANSPFSRATTETVTVQIRTALPITDKTWRVEWEEETRDRSGTIVSTQIWEASISIEVDLPKDEAVLMMNPTGLYVTNFSWTKRL